MKTRKNTVIIRKTPEQCITSVFLCAAFILLPLWVHRAYYDITRTKFMVFALLGGVYALSMLPFLLRCRLRFDLTDLFAAGFFGLLALTAALNGAWLGESSRYQGFASAVLYALCFIFVRRFGVFGRNEQLSLLLGFSLCALIAVSEFLGADPLGIVAATPEGERMRFTSTVGNISFFSALCCLVFPVPLCLYLRAKSKAGYGLYLFLSILFLTAAMVSRAESAVLGVLAGIFLIPALPSPECMGKYPLLLCFLCVWAYIFSLLSRLGLYGLSELTRSLTSVYIILPAGAVLLAVYFLLRGCPSEGLRKLSHIYRIIFISAAAVLVLFLLLANTVLKTALPEGLARYFVITDSWGTDRGLIWCRCLEYYGSLGFANRLFGAGAGSIALWDSLHPIFADAVTDSAHNEYLTYLITTGTAGLGLYIALLSSSVLKGARHILLPCVLAYSVQAFVNIAQPFTTPLFFLLLALVSGGEREDEAVPLLPEEFSASLIVILSLAVLLISAGFVSAAVG